MAYLILPGSRRTRQPSGPVRIDYNNPLTLGLVYAALPGYDAAIGLPNGLTIAGAGPSGLEAKGTYSSYLAAADVQARTIIAEHVYTSNAADWQGHAWGHYVSTGDNSTFGIGLAGSANQIYFANKRNNDNNTLSDSITFPYRRVWGMSGTFGSTATVYRDGVSYSSAESSGAAWATDSRRRYSVGSPTTTGKSYPWAYMWARILSDAEHLSIYRNPWQIFAPDPRRLYFGAGATGGGTVFESTYTDSNSLGDLISTLGEFTSTYSDSKTIGDSVSSTANLSSTYSDTTTLGDGEESSLGASIYNRDYVEGITLEDTYSANLSGLTTVTDAITLEETYLGYGVFVSQVSENTTLGDTEAGDSGILRDYIESITLGDSYNVNIIGYSGIEESTLYEDYLSSNAVMSSIIEEQETLADQYVGSVSIPSSGTVDLTPEAIDAIADEVMLRLYEIPVRRL